LFAKHAKSTNNKLDLDGFKEILPGLEIYSYVNTGNYAGYNSNDILGIRQGGERSYQL
jgi:hypothetical protein